jgi:Zn-dependent protease/CBS domain-containing protein
MDGNLKLGKIWGIPFRLHMSWFLIFGLLTWSLGTGYFPQAYPQLSSTSHWGLGAITSLLLALSVLAHELGHAFIALRNRIPVRGITLFIFGGVAQIEQEPESPGVEFRVAIAGPLVSFGLALVFGGLYLLDRSIPILAAPSEYLLRINLMLALFNLIPGFPLDGGRILRAFVWRWTRSYQRATQLATSTGQLVAFGFIGLGVFAIFNGQFFNGIWLAFIGWFLQNAASSARSYAQLQHTLRDVKVNQVMSNDCVQISGLTPLSRVVEEQVVAGGNRCFLISEDDRLDGILTLQDFARIPQSKWRYMTSRQAMLPLDRLGSVSPEADLLSAMNEMERTNASFLPVIQDKKVVGLLSRERVINYLGTRAELGV